MPVSFDHFGIARCECNDTGFRQARNFIAASFANPLWVADDNTARLTSLPQGALILKQPEPTLRQARAIAQAAAQADGFVALGSGTLSDLVKYAAFLAKKPYVMLPTATSMNGYLSVTSSLKGADGHKISHGARLPIALFADPSIIANAPMRLIQSGLGDAICRSTAQADWLLSHLLIESYYEPAPFAWVSRHEEYVCAHADALISRGPEAIQSLMQWLLWGGLGMTHCGGSYPASQGEHMLAHWLEENAPADTPKSFHGEQIAVTTLLMAEIQQKILSLPTAPQLKRRSLPEKNLDAQAVESINQRLQTDWPAIKQQILEVFIAPEALEATLKAAGAPITPQALGWNKTLINQALTHAPLSRNRLTFLDF